MRKFLCYIFYFTYRIYRNIGFNIIEKPLNSILIIIPFFSRNTKKRRILHKYFMNDYVSGMNIIFAYKSMLFTLQAFVCFIQLHLIFLLKINVADYFDNSYGINLGGKIFNAYAFMICELFFTFLISKLYIGWFSKKYITYFIEFEKKSNTCIGYFVTVSFHFLIILCSIFSAKLLL